MRSLPMHPKVSYKAVSRVFWGVFKVGGTIVYRWSSLKTGALGRASIRKSFRGGPVD
jgi:hypothetical protein